MLRLETFLHARIRGWARRLKTAGVLGDVCTSGNKQVSLQALDLKRQKEKSYELVDIRTREMPTSFTKLLIFPTAHVLVKGPAERNTSWKLARVCRYPSMDGGK